MILAYLILGHLVSDFILQPTGLVLWKMKSKLGGLVHASVHFVISTLLLMPITINGVYWLPLVTLLVSFIHFWIDEAKINYDLRHDNKVQPFLIDQLLHLLTILLVYFFIEETTYLLPNGAFYNFYTNITVVNFFSLLIFFSTVIEVYRFQKEREKNKRATFKVHRREMLMRVMVFTMLYIMFMAIAVFAFTKSPL